MESAAKKGPAPQAIRLGDRDFWIHITPEATGPSQSRAQRSELQLYGGEELKHLDEFTYTKLPSSTKRIRLLQLQSGTTHGPEICCELIVADYDNEFHIPTRADLGHPRVTQRGSAGKGRLGTNDKTVLSLGCDKEKTRKAGDIRRGKAQKKLEEDKKLKGMTDDEKDEYRKNKNKEEEEAEKEGLRERFEEVFDKEIEYEALSWCWGTGPEDFALQIKHGGKTYKKRIKKDLGLALKYLRKPNETRTLWIDAVCINQQDDGERNHQVQMMARIYTRAKEVCIWLGEDDETSKMAINFIREKVIRLKQFDDICSDKKYADSWEALMGLMQREWFSRRWVVQEIALARSATLYCGPDNISWNDFAVAVELFVEVESATHRLSEIMRKDEKFRHVPGWFDYVSELGASLLVQATGKVFRTRRTTSPGDSENLQDIREMRRKEILGERTIDPLDRRGLLSLEYLVSTLYIFKASEPRDAVYALLAIARDAAPFAKPSFDERDHSFLIMSVMKHFLEEKPFVVDYGRTYSDVCRDFVNFTIERKNKLDPVQALDILCRPWALEPPTGRSVWLAKKTVERAPRRRVLIPKEKPLPPRCSTPVARLLSCEEAEERKRWSKSEIENENRWEGAKSEPEGWWENVVWLWSGKGADPFKQKRKYICSPGIGSLSYGSNSSDWEPNTGKVLKDYWMDVEKTSSRKDFGASHDNWRKHPPGWDEVKWYFPEAGVASTAKADPLPRWVALSSRAPFSMYQHPGIITWKTGRSNADPLVGQPQDGHRNYSAAQTNPVDLDTLRFRRRQKCGHYSLYVRGFELDTVNKVLDASQGGNIPKSWLNLGGWENYDHDPPDHFWRTMVADRGRDNRNPPYYYSTACKESVQKGGIASGSVNTSDLINNERNSIVAEFCRRVQSVIWERRLFDTDTRGRKTIGLARDVRKGDKVCILYGCTVPVILRRVKKGSTKEALQKIIEDELLDDRIEALRSCVYNLETILERKERYRRMKERKGVEYEREIKEALAVARGKEREYKMRRLGAAATDTSKGSWLSSIWGSLFSPRASEAPVAEKKAPRRGDLMRGVTETPRYTEEPKKDDGVFYEFVGEAYVHGMMDGEALRMKFYEEIPDVLFELR